MDPPRSERDDHEERQGAELGSLLQALAVPRAKRSVVRKNSIIATSERARTTRAPAIVHRALFGE
jgi:hypothetical protein